MAFTERKIIFHGDYFTTFYLAQSAKVQEKIEFVLRIIRQVERIPQTFLKHIEGIDSLYEVRIQYGSDIYRIFCCFDEGYVVVLFNGFQKKSQKTPANELELATKLMNEYVDQKTEQHEQPNQKPKKR